MTFRRVRFKQVDVFASAPFKGNPLAVIFDADGLDATQMRAIARWTNLSETVFLQRPTDPRADYYVRIFTTGGELPFAGHPTLGTAHAWLESGHQPKRPGLLVQQCGIGLVDLVEQTSGSWAFAAPPVRITPLPVEHYPALAAALCSDAIDVGAQPCTVDNGAPWLVVRMHSAAACVAFTPDMAALKQFAHIAGTHGFAMYGPHAEGGPATFEVRCLMTGGDFGVGEDPVTGSANAALACLLDAQQRRPADSYTVRQGTAIGHDGRITVSYDARQVPWIGGSSITVVEGSFRLPG